MMYHLPMSGSRHGTHPSPHLLPVMRDHTYAGAVADSSDIRRLRVEPELWAAYTEIVGDGGRSSDLKAYIEWRVDNPSTPLPGRRRGPEKRVRRSNTTSDD